MDARIEEESGGGPTTPMDESIGLGSSAFARRYLRNLFDFFSSGYLDVSVHPVPSTQTMYLSVSDEVLPRRVSPFGYPRIKALVQLPWAFRRLRVLLRQLVPRHSSMTLFSLNYSQLYRVLDALLLFFTITVIVIQSLFGFQRSFGSLERLSTRLTLLSIRLAFFPGDENMLLRWFSRCQQALEVFVDFRDFSLFWLVLKLLGLARNLPTRGSSFRS